MVPAMSALKRAFLFYASLPLNLFLAWPIVLAVRVLWGADLRFERWIMSSEFEPGSWPLTPGTWPKGFYLQNRKAILEARVKGETPPPIDMWGGSSIGDGQIFAPGIRTPKGTALVQISRTEWHESRHTKQSRTAQVAACIESHLLASILAIAGQWELGLVLGFLVWFLGGNVATAAAGWLTAVLEGDPRGFYRGSVHELDAYDSGDLWESLTPEQRRQRLEVG